MKRVSSLEVQGRKKCKPEVRAKDLERTNKDEVALRHFAELRAMARSGNEEEMHQVFSILRDWRVFNTYGHRAYPLMPELYCFLAVISNLSPSKESIAERLPGVIDLIEIAKWSNSTQSTGYECETFQRAIIAAVRMIDNIPYDPEGDYKVLWGDLEEALEKYGYCANFQKIRNMLNDIWNPPYWCILPKSILYNIFSRLDLQGARNCTRVCRRFRKIVFKVLNSKPIGLSALPPRFIPSKGISRLPTELIISIFDYLNTCTLQACAATCQSWRLIIMNSPGVWTKNVLLEGEPSRIDKQWTKVLQLAGGNKMTALSIKVGKQYETWGLRTHYIRLESFPHDSLQYFSCDVLYAATLDDEVWKQLIKCSRLKVLRCWGASFMDCKMKVPRDSNLAKCRLEELKLTSCDDEEMDIVWDDVFCSLICNVKRLSLKLELSKVVVQRILAAVESTVQTLHLGTDTLSEHARRPTGDITFSNEEKDLSRTELNMIQLKSLTGFTSSACRINAPLLEKLDMALKPTSNFDILKTSFANLRDFTCHLINLSKMNAACLQDFLNSLKHMTVCHTFTLHVRNTSRSFMDEDRVELAKLFWKKILSDDDKLPSLKHLAVSEHDQNSLNEGLDAEMLLAFVQARKDRGLELTSLRLLYLGHFSIESILKLQKVVPFLTNTMMESEHRGCPAYYESEYESSDIYPPPRTVVYPEPEGVTRIR